MPNLPLSLNPWIDAPRWTLAFSGGLDSTVLLHALCQYAANHGAPPLRAVHIHHGLQTVAEDWPRHCQQVCDELGVTLQVVRVQVATGASLEQAARTARYQALSERLVPGEVVFTAQHQDDQAETLLLRLLRGAGLRGLASMPVQRALGHGWLARPLLGHSREQLLSYAQAAGLRWIDDPSNLDPRFARNYLRGSLMPLLQARWPHANANLARTASHLDEAQVLLDEVAEDDLRPARAGAPDAWSKLDSLDLDTLRRLSPARQRNALQAWLVPRTRLPDSRHWQGWEDLRDAAPDAQPLWRLTDGVLQRSHGRIWWLAGDWLTVPSGGVGWPDPRQPLTLPGNGQVQWQGAAPSGLWRVDYRHGGEVLTVPGRGQRDLKRLLNERQVPHFLRSRLPLLWQGDRLLAVANLPMLTDAPGQLHWHLPGSAQGLS